MSEWAYTNYGDITVRCRLTPSSSPAPRHTLRTRPPFAGLPAVGLGGWEIEVCDRALLAPEIAESLSGLADGIWLVFDENDRVVGGFTPPEEVIWEEQGWRHPSEFRGSRRRWGRRRED